MREREKSLPQSGNEQRLPCSPVACLPTTLAKLFGHTRKQYIRDRLNRFNPAIHTSTVHTDAVWTAVNPSHGNGNYPAGKKKNKTHEIGVKANSTNTDRIRQAMYAYSNTKACTLELTTAALGTQYLTLCVSTLALVIQNGKGMRRITICVACPALTFSHPQTVRFSANTKFTEHKMCVLISSTTFVWNISHSRKNWARYDEKCISVCM